MQTVYQLIDNLPPSVVLFVMGGVAAGLLISMKATRPRE